MLRVIHVLKAHDCAPQKRAGEVWQSETPPAPRPPGASERPVHGAGWTLVFG